MFDRAGTCCVRDFVHAQVCILCLMIRVKYVCGDDAVLSRMRSMCMYRGYMICMCACMYMYVCVCLFMYVCMYVCMYVFACTNHISICVRVYTYVYASAIYCMA
jgi:hypothetical protein